MKDDRLLAVPVSYTPGENPFIVINEIYLLFHHEYSANFLLTLWKRVRKYGAFCTGITQNVDDLLQSHTARTMPANRKFIVMLKNLLIGGRSEDYSFFLNNSYSL